MEVLGAHYEPSIVARSRRRRQPQALQVGCYLLSQQPPSPILQHLGRGRLSVQWAQLGAGTGNDSDRGD